ncbi:MAG: hypothetical protein RLZZ244_1296 [Verrucomicrobiota bacterium]|jgi:hypothetical protein
MKEYKAVIYQESMLGSLVLGESKVDPVRLTEFLNRHASQGWEVKTMEREIRRMLLFFKREALVFILERNQS